MNGMGDGSEAPDPGKNAREVRLALVLNGGVSLAIWIGGVVSEIDSLRRASDAEHFPKVEGTSRLYRRLLGILEETVTIDVIAGASAGGINGILLGAAIFAGKPLPPELRETWIELGDFRTLLRSPSESDPPSLMKGDEVVLKKLNSVLGGLLEGADGKDCKQPHLYLYVTATDLYGYVCQFRDSTDRAFDEFDYRRTFQFKYARPAKDPWEKDVPVVVAQDLLNVMRAVVDFRDPDAVDLLAQAARSTSSFPVAFEPHRLKFPAVGGEATPGSGEADTAAGPAASEWHWMIDGGVLDNQPFNPVLNQIAVLPPGDLPVKRVVAYVVPYVNERGSLDPSAPEKTSALATYGASGAIPRTLSKLQSLDRVTSDRVEQQIANDDTARLWDTLRGRESTQAATALFSAYVRTRDRAVRRTFAQWADPYFRPGDGVLAEDPTSAPRSLKPPPPASVDPHDGIEALPNEPWLPSAPDWEVTEKQWSWGLAPAERAAAWALLSSRRPRGSPPELAALTQARRELASLAGNLIWDIRAEKELFHYAFTAQPDGDVLKRARDAFVSISFRMPVLQERFAKLDAAIVALNDLLPAERRLPRIRDLLHLEVVRNALTVGDPRVPFPFEFLFMSAGVANSLGHQASEPMEKLAGMKLGHFAGFLKRSWRANDWLWGRLDGVEHVLRATLDVERLQELGWQAEQARELAEIAFPSAGPNDPRALSAVGEAWAKSLLRDQQKKEPKADPVLTDEENQHAPKDQFVIALVKAGNRSSDRGYRDRCLQCCRAALAARIQLEILKEDLERVAETAADDADAGTSKLASGFLWASRFFRRNTELLQVGKRELDTADRVALFKALEIGSDEDPVNEISSRLTLDLAAQGAAVGAAMVAGNRSGLPPSVRAPLATLRAITLALSSVVRLLARSPLVGAALIFVLSVLLVWGLVSPGVLLGSLTPALAILVLIGGTALLTIATGTFEQSISTTKRILAFTVLLGVPLAFALTAKWPGVDGVPGWLDRHVSGWAVTLSAALALAAACVAAARGVLEVSRRAHAQGSTSPTRREKELRAENERLAAALKGHAATETTTQGPRPSHPKRAALEPIRGIPLRWIRTILNVYRALVIAALAALALGFTVDRLSGDSPPEGCPTTGCAGIDWKHVADERRGTFLIVALILVFLLSAAIVELVLPQLQKRLGRPHPVAQYEATLLGSRGRRLLSLLRLPFILSIFDDRVECRQPGVIKRGPTETIRYQQVAQVVVHRGVLWSGLTVETIAGGGFRIDGLRKKDAEAAKAALDSRVASASGPDHGAQLEKLKSLYAAGVLTDTEFAAAERRLLN
jgi:predicted acylesterase/phospholipase RssA